MTYTTYTTKQFIAEFNFAEPDWDSLPPNFPNIAKDELTREEGHLLDAIKLAHFATAGGWKEGLTAQRGQALLAGLICLTTRARGQAMLLVFVVALLIGLIRSASQGQGSLAQPVQAATHTVNQVIESTMSAILKR